MKKSDLIKQLNEIPGDPEVCVFDVNLSEMRASEEPSSEGVFKDFSVELMPMYNEDKEFVVLEFLNNFYESIPKICENCGEEIPV